MQERNPAVLVLEDGTVFHGKSIGNPGVTYGEIAFNTGMTGYQEVFTDPSYFGQILVMTTSHIGNYGVHAEEIESDDMKIAGIVIKKFSEVYSRASAEGSLEENMVRDNKIGICDVDTRALVRYIRNKGAMNAIISTEENFDIDALKQQVKEVPSMEGLELSSKVCTKEAFEVKATTESKYKVALYDFGVKKNIVRCLQERGCDVKVFPMDAPLEDLKAYNPDGYMLSNGPGDPSVMPDVIEKVKTLVEGDTPIFGICLGHQLLSLSQGLTTKKMFNGHRGLNHPVKNLITGKGEITSQNHGFVVDEDSLKNNENVELTHIHLNDNTVAGIRLKNKAVFSVQYHPEASAGPHDSRYLFDQFIDNMKNN
ncbi:glutamine-hydrolyzing carbamoyl-phosphate synthase small subunit [Lishizhenia sp.]|uniref:glutamine-hydrolyzing carbamoyl-phosphate synthase small subunit n=1 Tax=Lishizhenia sp. TaxID=2497594 RepID=UPI00299E51F7|nr:glutamine-hydrolyzing carbamoyl-phosphate synthase small subunit [Lishizhenia sp.]MDX1446716.1 glutamine-hydrolyzing carbamoyl-phosphate synthase small subunit [Lishizhenia sp.]